MIFDILLVLLLAGLLYWFLSSQYFKPKEAGTPTFPFFRKSSRAAQSPVTETAVQVAALREQVGVTRELVSLKSEQKRLEGEITQLTAEQPAEQKE